MTTPLASIMTELSKTEKIVLALVCNGERTKNIAHMMGISSSTVTVHKFNLRRKLGAKSDIEIYQKAVELGLASPSSAPAPEPPACSPLS